MDAEVFAEQATGLHQQLARATLLLCGDRELAEESAQEALMRAWGRVDRGASIESLTAWTTTVAMNWCRSQLRRRGAETRAVRRIGPRRSTSETDLAIAPDIEQAVLALPFRQRQVVVLHYFLDQDIATIARTARIATGAVMSRTPCSTLAPRWPSAAGPPQSA